MCRGSEDDRSLSVLSPVGISDCRCVCADPRTPSPKFASCSEENCGVWKAGTCETNLYLRIISGYKLYRAHH